MAKKTTTKNSGLGMAANNHFKHQKIQSIIYENYLRKFVDNNILTETKLSDDLPIICPDISIWENAHKYDDIAPENPLVTIEVTHTKKNEQNSEDVIKNSFAHYPSILESFIYNFESDMWRRYSRTEDGILKEIGKDYSRVLKCYLHTFLK